MSVAEFYLTERVEAAIKKLIAHDASWSRILARDLERALKDLAKERKPKQPAKGGGGE